MMTRPESEVRGSEPCTTSAACCHVHQHHTHIERGVDIGQRTSDSGRIRWWSHVIAYLRHWSGDDAYERYLADHQHHGHELLSRREFYRRYLDHRAGGSRCC